MHTTHSTGRTSQGFAEGEAESETEGQGRSKDSDESPQAE